MRIFARFAYQRAFLDRGIAALSNVPSCRNASFMFVYMASLKHHAQESKIGVEASKYFDIKRSLQQSAGCIDAVEK